MNHSLDLPISALCIVTDKGKCPANYTPIFKSYDTNTETDLWKDGLFGKKINRYICYTKDYPIQDTYNVIEDIKILNERETLGGFIPIDKCFDTSEKAFQKKVMCVKVSPRFYTPTAVSDIIILIKNKRPPYGYSYIGEINNQSICIKFSQIPKNSPTSAKQAIAPPVPPRPYSSPNLNQDAIVEKDFVAIDWSNVKPIATDLNNRDNPFEIQNRALNSQHSLTNSNPLHGVPFEINPIYESLKANSSSNQLLDAEKINRKLLAFNQTLERIDYDFKLERACLQSL